MAATNLSRRSLLTVGGVGVVAGVALLSGCAPAGAPAQSGAVITPLSSVPVGGSLNVDLDGRAIVISQPTAGVVTAFSAICTHQGCKVGGRDGVFQCPCHGSEFSFTTGEPLTGPANIPLDKFAVKIDGPNIVVA